MQLHFVTKNVVFFFNFYFFTEIFNTDIFYLICKKRKQSNWPEQCCIIHAKHFFVFFGGFFGFRLVLDSV